MQVTYALPQLFQLVSCMQVALAQLLQWIHNVSAANNNALPVIVAHNANKDVQALVWLARQAGMDIPDEWQWHCSWRSYKELAEGVSETSHIRKAGKGNLNLLAAWAGCAS